MAEDLKKFSDIEKIKELLSTDISSKQERSFVLNELIRRKEKRQTAKKDPKTRKTESTNVKRNPLRVGDKDIIFTNEEGNNYTATITGDFKDFDLETFVDEYVRMDEITTLTIGKDVQITSFPHVDDFDNTFDFDNLQNIVIPNGNPNLELDQNGVLYNKEKTILIKSPVTNSGELVIPNTVETIGSQAFLGCEELTGSLTLPASLVTIGAKAFKHCNNLGQGPLTIPLSVTSIGVDAFLGVGFLSNLIKIRIWKETATALDIEQGKCIYFFGIDKKVEFIDDFILKPGWNSIGVNVVDKRVQLITTQANPASITDAYYFDSDNNTYTRIVRTPNDNSSISLEDLQDRRQLGLWLNIDSHDDVYYELTGDDSVGQFKGWTTGSSFSSGPGGCSIM